MTAAMPFIELEVVHAGLRRRYRLEGTPLAIGRHDECDLPLKVEGVSRYHLRLLFDGSAWRAEPHPGATQPTSCNGYPLRGPRALEPGDVLQCADVQIAVVTVPAAMAAFDTDEPTEHMAAGSADQPTRQMATVGDAGPTRPTATRGDGGPTRERVAGDDDGPTRQVPTRGGATLELPAHGGAPVRAVPSRVTPPPVFEEPTLRMPPPSEEPTVQMPTREQAADGGLVDFVDDGLGGEAPPVAPPRAAEEAARRERRRKAYVFGGAGVVVVASLAVLLWPKPPPPAEAPKAAEDLCAIAFEVEQPAPCAAAPECARRASEALARAQRVLETAKSDATRQFEALTQARAAIVLGKASGGAFDDMQIRAAAEVARTISDGLKRLCADARMAKSVALREGRYADAARICRRLLEHVPNPKDPRHGWARECVAEMEQWIR